MLAASALIEQLEMVIDQIINVGACDSVASVRRLITAIERNGVRCDVMPEPVLDDMDGPPLDGHFVQMCLPHGSHILIQTPDASGKVSDA